MSKNDALFVEERQNTIFNILQREKRATIVELSEHFQTGAATIRRDLNAMEKRGLIRRTHGGAIAIRKTNVEHGMEERIEENKLEKENNVNKSLAKAAKRISQKTLKYNMDFKKLKAALKESDSKDPMMAKLIEKVNGMLTSKNL